MKEKFILTTIAIITGTLIIAQKAPVIKVYAYSQTVLPGAKKNIAVEENGNEVKQSAEKKVNYFFYAEQKKSVVIKVTAVWMHGKKFTVKTDSVSKTPIEITTGGAPSESNKIVLTPAAGNKFLLILPGEAATSGLKVSGSLKKMIRRSELVLVYQWKGVTRYFPVKEIKILEPLASV